MRACRKLSHDLIPEVIVFFLRSVIEYFSICLVVCSLLSPLNTHPHTSNSTEDEVTMLCIAAPHAVLVGVRVYAQRQESALGASHGE